MKTHVFFRNPVVGIGFFTSLLAIAVQAQIPWADDPFKRQGRGEVYGVGQYLHTGDVHFDGPYGDTKLKFDDTGLGGLGFAYHFNDYFSIHSDFMFGSASVQAEGPGSGSNPWGLVHDAFISSGRFNVDYNMINRRLSPFLTAGIGYQYLEAELEDHPDVGVCWWDPWWGYYCEYGKPVHYETDFTWNVGGGFRWDVTDHFFFKAAAGAQWLNFEDADGITTQIEAFLSIGWSF